MENLAYFAWSLPISLQMNVPIKPWKVVTGYPVIDKRRSSLIDGQGLNWSFVIKLRQNNVFRIDN
jgi:hypothetical protein